MSDEGRYSKVSRRIWNDEKFRRLSAPKPNGQALFLRLLTGPELGCIPGLFQAWDAGLAQALDWPVRGFSRALNEILREGLARRDASTGLIFLPNAVNHNEPASPNVIKSWTIAWRELPECELKTEARKHFDEVFAAKGPAWAKAFLEATGRDEPKSSGKPSGNELAKASGKPCPNQEQEQEQEQENEKGGATMVTARQPIETHDTSDTLVPCPREILDGDTIAIIASALKVSPAAVRGGLKEFKDYWTIGAGAGRRHSLAKWRAKAREDVRQKAGRGLLLEPETPDPQVPEVDNERRNSERLAREQAYAAQARERLLGGPVATLSAVRRRNGPEAPTETKARETGAQEPQQTARVAQ